MREKALKVLPEEDLDVAVSRLLDQVVVQAVVEKRRPALLHRWIPREHRQEFRRADVRLCQPERLQLEYLAHLSRAGKKARTAARVLSSLRQFYRVALREGSLVVNSSQGGGSKDTWVLER